MAHAKKLSRTNDHAKAARELNAATQLDPSFADAHHLLATEYGLLGRLQEAAAEFRRLLELEPDNWIGHLGLAVALLQSGDFRGAEESARRAVQLEPGDPTANLVLGCGVAARDDGRREALPYLRYAARTLPEAREFLQKLESVGAAGSGGN